jgi:hypothetical protein
MLDISLPDQAEHSWGYGMPIAKTPAPEPVVPANWKPPTLAKTTITVEFKQDGKVKTIARCKTIEEAEQLAREYGPNHYVRISHIYKDASA